MTRALLKYKIYLFLMLWPVSLLAFHKKSEESIKHQTCIVLVHDLDLLTQKRLIAYKDSAFGDKRLSAESARLWNEMAYAYQDAGLNKILHDKLKNHGYHVKYYDTTVTEQFLKALLKDLLAVEDFIAAHAKPGDLYLEILPAFRFNQHKVHHDREVTWKPELVKFETARSGNHLDKLVMFSGSITEHPFTFTAKHMEDSLNKSLHGFPQCVIAQ